MFTGDKNIINKNEITKKQTKRLGFYPLAAVTKKKRATRPGLEPVGNFPTE